MSAAEVLGVSPDAPIEAIKKAYYALARRLHPDHGGRPADFAKVRSAYEVLLERRDPSRSRTYLQPERNATVDDGQSGPETVLRVRRKSHGHSESDVASARIHQATTSASDKTAFRVPTVAAWRSPIDGVPFVRSAPPPPFRHSGIVRADRLPTSVRAPNGAESRPLLEMFDRVPGSAIFVMFLLIFALLQGLGGVLTRSFSLGSATMSIGLILFPAGIASMLGADNHFGARRVFVGVALFLVATFAVVARLTM